MSKITSLLYTGITGNYVPTPDAVEKADCIVMDAFGIGHSNQQMMAHALRALPDSLPMFLPWELSEEFQVQVERPDRQIESYGLPGSKHNALEVMSWASKRMAAAGLKRPIIVAHSYEIARCGAVMERLGYDPIIPPGLETIPFDRHSLQLRTRSRWAWRLREPLVVMYFMVKGWL